LGSLKVFGLGLNKTGTTSLGISLSRLGFRHVSCRRDLLQLYRAGDLTAIFRVCDQYEAFDDWPYPLMYRELFDRYRDRARYVLTTRSTPERWLASLKSHALRTLPEAHCRKLAYGFDYPHGYEREHLALYESHNAAVRAHFQSAGASHLLLEVCWENGDGWPQLCRFLKCRLPRRPFPHANKSSDATPNPAHVARNQANIARQLAQLSQPAQLSVSRVDATEMASSI
jgi:hypothetical protein